MAKGLPFDVLCDLAQSAVKKARDAIAASMEQEREAQQQLALLQQYRQDYLEKLQSSLQAGMRSSSVSNIQRFIDNIDEAIARQHERINSLAQASDERREIWLQERKKEQSMQTLLARQTEKQLAAQGRAEQKQNDEFAARAFYRARAI